MRTARAFNNLLTNFFLTVTFTHIFLVISVTQTYLSQFATFSWERLQYLHVFQKSIPALVKIGYFFNLKKQKNCLSEMCYINLLGKYNYSNHSSCSKFIIIALKPQGSVFIVLLYACALLSKTKPKKN